MMRKQMILWGAALLSAAIGLEVSIGKDTPPNGKKSVPAATENDNGKTADVSKGKPTKDVKAEKDASTGLQKPDDQSAAVEPSADEVAIRKTGETYVKAYCAADAKELASHFAVDAEYIDEEGDTYQGREAIEGAMAEVFAENAGGQIALDIESIRFLSPGLAIEDGTTIFTASKDADPIYSRYTAVHVKTNGEWLAASVREHAPKDRRQHRTKLQQLAWLQGDWVEESDDSLVLFSCTSVAKGNYLIRDFEICIGGRADLNGTQRIGWDPLTGKLKAWTFDSDGGYSDGYWHHDGDCWSLKTTGVTSEGQPVSETSNYTYVNEHTVTWQSVDREIAGVAQPDSEVLTIVRRAPTPEIIVEIPLSTSK